MPARFPAIHHVLRGRWLRIALAVLLALLSWLLIALSAHASEIQRSFSPEVRVIYHFFQEDPAAISSFSDYQQISTEVFYTTREINDDVITIRANNFPELLKTSADPLNMRVMLDYASASGVSRRTQQDITRSCSYDPSEGLLDVPIEYRDRDLTVIWYLPESAACELPVEVHVTHQRNPQDQTTLTIPLDAREKVINLQLFSDDPHLDSDDLSVRQNALSCDNFRFQNGFLSLMAPPVGGAIEIEVCDDPKPFDLLKILSVPETAPFESCQFEPTVVQKAAMPSATVPSATVPSATVPSSTVPSAAIPSKGQRFTLDSDTALIINSDYGDNTGSITGWPEKDKHYGFAVHFGHNRSRQEKDLPFPELSQADESHVASGGTYISSDPDGDPVDYSWISGYHFAWGDCKGDVADNGFGNPVVKSGWIQVEDVSLESSTLSCSYELDVKADSDGHDMQSIVGQFQVHKDFGGYLDIQKTSANPTISDSNVNYRLGGAVYGVFSDRGCHQEVCRITTNNHGFGSSPLLPIGTYFIKELTAPSGFALDSTIYEADVQAATHSTVQGGSLKDIPLNNPVELVLSKLDKDVGEASAQGNASLADAQFRVSYYEECFSDANQAAAKKSKRQWTLKTDESGRCELNDDHKVSGDDFYRDSLGQPTFPLGTIVIEEISAPKGYLLDTTKYCICINGRSHQEHLSLYQAPIITETVIRGGVKVQKSDQELKINHPLGAAKLEGTQFEIVSLNKQAVIVEGTSYKESEVVSTLTTDEKGQASTSDHFLPYGSYSLREVKAPEGYQRTDDKARTFTIEQDGMKIAFEHEQSFFDQVFRGDLSLVKAAGNDMHRLSRVPFRLTSHSTGESHVLITDDNGQASTSADWNPHSQRTNANDQDWQNNLDDGAGIWFGKGPEEISSPVDDQLGALPYDTYSLQELPCKANEGYRLVSLDNIAITRDKYCIDIGTILNGLDSEPYLSTCAQDAVDGDRLVTASAEVIIRDSVIYGNLSPQKEYELRGHLVYSDSGKPYRDEDHLVSATKTFTTESSHGYVELELSFNSGEVLEPIDLTVVEELYDGDLLVASHTDPLDHLQMVQLRPVAIETKASDAQDGDQVLSPGPNTTIYDAVSYEHLIPGKTYRMVGTLRDRENGEPLTDADGPITHEEEFIPTSENGELRMAFTFDSDTFYDHDMPVEGYLSEELYEQDTLLVTHSDPENQSQHVSVEQPVLSTYASDKTDRSQELLATENACIVDEVRYQNLIPHKEYFFEGILMDKTDGAPVHVGDKEIRASGSFIPDQSDGTLLVEFELDASSLANHEIVVFETISTEQAAIAVHNDLEDSDQTVRFIDPEPPAQLHKFLAKTGDDIVHSMIPLVAISGFCAFFLLRIGLRRR